jgi:hypothetical protein
MLLGHQTAQDNVPPLNKFRDVLDSFDETDREGLRNWWVELLVEAQRLLRERGSIREFRIYDDDPKRRARRQRDLEKERAQAKARYWSNPEKHRAQARERARSERGRARNRRAVARYRERSPRNRRRAARGAESGPPRRDPGLTRLRDQGLPRDRRPAPASSRLPEASRHHPGMPPASRISPSPRPAGVEAARPAEVGEGTSYLSQSSRLNSSQPATRIDQTSVDNRFEKARLSATRSPSGVLGFASATARARA